MVPTQYSASRDLPEVQEPLLESRAQTGCERMTQYLKVHFMSQRTNWQTPAALYAELDREFHFTMDPCPPNYKQDGLKMKWTGVVYCNPPYGRMIGNWVRKAHYSHIEGTIVVLLLPARTDTRWFHDYLGDAELRFIKGRLHFDDRGPAPFPSVIAILRPKQAVKQSDD